MRPRFAKTLTLIAFAPSITAHALAGSTQHQIQLAVERYREANIEALSNPCGSPAANFTDQPVLSLLEGNWNSLRFTASSSKLKASATTPPPRIDRVLKSVRSSLATWLRQPNDRKALLAYLIDSNTAQIEILKAKPDSLSKPTLELMAAISLACENLRPSRDSELDTNVTNVHKGGI